MINQQFLDREMELFKLNAKLNLKAKKMSKQNRVQIHTANNNLNYYVEDSQAKCDDDSPNFELKCKKMHITNQPVKKSQEIAYPFNSRQTSLASNSKQRRVMTLHMPTNSLIADGNADDTETQGQTENTSCFENESLEVMRHSDDIPQLDNSIAIPLPPPTDVIPKCIEKKISNDGLMKFLKSKVAILQTELEMSKKANDAFEKENSKNAKKITKFQSQVEKSNSKILALESALKNLQEEHASTKEDLKDKDNTVVELRRELSATKKAYEELSHNYNVCEKKLLKIEKEYESVKFHLESNKDIEINMQKAAKDERTAYEEKMKRLKKGRIDLLKAYKQQIIFIDNLRNQNVCLEKIKALEIAEKEFLKVLDYNFTEKFD